METQMKLDGAKVRVLREEKSWSQEHLASASGLSARTIQRVESEGIGSAETRLALAAALGVAVAALAANSSVVIADSMPPTHSTIGGWAGWCAGGACSIGAIIYQQSMGAITHEYAAFSIGIICGLLGLCAGVMGALKGVLSALSART